MASKRRYVIQMKVRILDEDHGYKEVYQYTQSDRYRKFTRKDSAMKYVKNVIQMIKPLFCEPPEED